MPMPNYPAPATAGAYRPPGSNATTGYQPYPPAYTGAGQAAQPSQIAPNQPPFLGYPQGFAPYSQTTQTYSQQTGKTHLQSCFYAAGFNTSTAMQF